MKVRVKLLPNSYYPEYGLKPGDELDVIRGPCTGPPHGPGCWVLDRNWNEFFLYSWEYEVIDEKGTPQ